MGADRVYTLRSGSKVILKVNEEGSPDLKLDGEMVASMAELENKGSAGKIVIRGEGFQADSVAASVAAAKTRRLTVVLKTRDQLEEWIEAFDPGWLPGPLWTAFTGLTVATFGAIGYLKAGSKISGISGGTIGASMCLSAWSVRSGRQPRVGHTAAIGLGCLVAGSMGPKAWHKKVLYPGGIASIASVLCILTNIFGLLQS